MDFASEEFDRLDKDHNGELDVTEIPQSKLRANRQVQVNRASLLPPFPPAQGVEIAHETADRRSVLASGSEMELTIDRRETEPNYRQRMIAEVVGH
jgi:hypothetical protein